MDYFMILGHLNMHMNRQASLLLYQSAYKLQVTQRSK